MTKFGQRILEARLAKGLSQAEFATQLGVGLTTTYLWERDRLPRPGNLPKIARLLEIDIKELAHLIAEAMLKEDK